MKYAVAVLMLSLSLFAQDVKKKPELTTDEKLAIRSAQVRLSEAKDQKTLLTEQADKAVSEALAGLTQTVNTVYASHKITLQEYTLCENPSAGVCAKAPTGDLSLQPIKEVKEEKK